MCRHLYTVLGISTRAAGLLDCYSGKPRGAYRCARRDRRDVVSRYVYSNRSILSREAQWSEDTKRLKPIRRVAGQAVVGTFQNVGLCIVQAEVSIEPPHR